MVTRTRILAVAAVAVSSALFACSAILGLDDTNVVPGYQRDASAASDATSDAKDASDATAFADADADAGPACDADLTTDPKNCGSCGHDCLGGTCVAAKCQPIVLLDGVQYKPTGLAVDDTSVFVMEDNTQSILRVGKDGDAGVATVVANEPNLFDMVASGGYVYFSNPTSADGGAGMVSRCATSGCTQGTRLDFTKANKHPQSLAMDSTQLYYAYSDSNGEVWACDLPGCSNAKRQTVALEPFSLTLSGNRVYWYSYQSPDLSYCNKGGCVGNGVYTHTGSVNLVYGMAADATYLYIADVAGTVSRVETALFQSEDKLAAGQASPHYLLEDGGYLFWINRGTGPNFTDGALLRCPKAACGANLEVLASGLKVVFALVQDADALYYASSADGKVWRLRKP
jgi:hypothetical protein